MTMMDATSRPRTKELMSTFHVDHVTWINHRNHAYHCKQLYESVGVIKDHAVLFKSLKELTLIIKSGNLQKLI